MKVYFTSPRQGQKEFGEFYKKIFSTIKKLGYDHVDDTVVSSSYDDFIENVASKGRSEYIKYFQAIEKNVKKADICIFDVSFPTLGLGYIIDYAVKLSKPTIVLYYKDFVPHTLIGVDEEKLVVNNYADNNLESVIKESLKQAREKRDKRFNFFLSPKLLHYLEFESDREGVTKSKLLRDMIVKHMRENEEYS